MRGIANLRGMSERVTGDPENQEQLAVRRKRPAWLRTVAAVACWIVVLASFGFAVVRVFGLERTWTGHTVIAFTPYVTALSVVPLALAAILRRWRAAGVAFVATVALVCVMIPRMVGGADPVRGPELHVMGTNMRVGGADPDRIVALAHDHQVDVLAVQEYTPEGESALAAAGLDALLPYAEKHPVAGVGGSAIYSRYPLTDRGYTAFPGHFGQAYATVLVPGAAPILVTSIHPCAPAAPSRIKPWAQGLEREPAASPHGPVRLLIGDFNSTLDNAQLRDIIDTGYVDAAAKLGDGLTTTWPYYGPKAGHVPPIALDHVLADSRIGISSFGTARVAKTDHKSIFATLTLPRA